MHMWQPAETAIFAAMTLVVMPPEPTSDADAPAMDSISGVICRTSRMNCAFGSLFGSAVNNPSTSDSRIRQSAPGHLRDARRETVVVAVADFRSGHGVILVDHRERAQGEQRIQGGARVEVTPAALAILEGEQHLRHRDLATFEQLLVGVRQPDLTNRRGGLAFLEPQRPLCKLQFPAAERNRARRTRE